MSRRLVNRGFTEIVAGIGGPDARALAPVAAGMPVAQPR